jgi:SET domain-containing protein
MFFIPTELRPSTIQGIGVFALVPLKKGQLLWRFDSRIDRLISKGEMDSMPDLTRQFVEIYAPWNRSTGLWLLCGDNAKYCNHSSNPTLLSLGPFDDDIAAQDLDAGAELTADYHDAYDNKDLLARMMLR